MKKTRLLIFAAIAAFLFAACQAPPAANVANVGNTSASANANANTAGATGTVPTADMLLNFDKLWHEAYTSGNSDFFEGVMEDKFVMLAADGTRLDKAGARKVIAGVKCDLPEPEFSEPVRTVIDADTYAVSYKAVFKGTCSEAGGKASRRPSPVRAATVWVRAPGDNWKVAFHGENLIVDQNGVPKAAAPARPADAKAPAADAVTGELVAAERAIGEAWKDKDNAKLDAMLAPGLGFVNLFGTVFATKTEVLKDWTGSGCDIKSVSVDDGIGISLSPTVGILASKGTAVGTCSGQKVGSEYVTSFYVKDGTGWKLAFGFNAPAP